MITSMRGCVAHNGLWPWPISSKSFNHDFAIKPLKYVTFYRARSTARTVLDGFFPYWAQMNISMRGCVVHNDLWPWPLSSRSLSHFFAIKLLKCRTSCRFRSTACAILDYIHMWHKYNPWGGEVSCTILQVNRSKVKVTRIVRIFAVGSGVS